MEKIFFFLGTFDKREKLSAKFLQNEAIIINEKDNFARKCLYFGGSKKLLREKWRENIIAQRCFRNTKRLPLTTKKTLYDYFKSILRKNKYSIRKIRII